MPDLPRALSRNLTASSIILPKGMVIAVRSVVSEVSFCPLSPYPKVSVPAKTYEEWNRGRVESYDELLGGPGRNQECLGDWSQDPISGGEFGILFVW